MPSSRGPSRQGMLGGVIVTLLAEGIALPAGLITAAVLTRGLGPEIYGGFTVVASSIATLEWLLIAILARAVVKVVAEADDWRPVAVTSFRAYVLSGLLIAATIWALADPVAAALNDPSMARYFRMFAPQIPIFAIGAGCKGILAGRGRYRQQAMASAVGWIGRVVFIVLFVQLGWGLDGAILGSISGTLVGALVALGLTGKVVWSRVGSPVRELMQLALPAFMAMFFARLLDQVGILSLEALGTNPAEVGYFGAAMNVLMVTSMIAAAVTPALVSTLTAARHQGDHVAVEQVSIGSIRFGLVLFPFAVLVAGAAHELVPILFGSPFAPAAPLMGLLIIGAIARASIVMVAAMLISLNRAWVAAAIAAPLPILAVIAHAIFIPRYGAIAAAWIAASLAVAGAAVSVAVFCGLSGLRPPVATLLRSTLVSVGVYYAALWWPAPGALVFPKLIALSVGLTAAFLLAGELTRVEIAALRRALPGSPPAPR